MKRGLAWQVKAIKGGTVEVFESDTGVHIMTQDAHYDSSKWLILDLRRIKQLQSALRQAVERLEAAQ